MTTILLVEDNPGFKHLFRELLGESSIKFKLVEVSDPIEGLEVLTKHNYNFNFVICDFFLPIQNGNDFLEIVKSNNKTISCLLISSDDSLKSKSFPGVDQFFSKAQAFSIIKYLENNQSINP